MVGAWKVVLWEVWQVFEMYSTALQFGCSFAALQNLAIARCVSNVGTYASMRQTCTAQWLRPEVWFVQTKFRSKQQPAADEIQSLVACDSASVVESIENRLNCKRNCPIATCYGELPVSTIPSATVLQICNLIA